MNRRQNTIAYSILLLIISVLMFSSCAPTFELSITGTNGGTVSLQPSGGAYKEGEVVTLLATPDIGYSFTGWGNISGYSADNATSREIEIIMPAENLSVSAGFTVPGEGWTFMVYMAGDNSLSDYVSKDINEIEKGLYDALNGGNPAVQGDARVLILSDRSGSTDTRLYLASPDNDSGTIASSVIVDDVYSTSSELNMADPDTLSDFISYGLTKYPSQYNALVLWNHGGGVKSLEPAPISKEICEDDGELMYLNEVQTAVSSALGSTKLNIFGIDACIMGEVETAYEMRNLTDYFVASMAEEWGNGWGYNYIFNKFTTPGSPPEPAAMADILVTQFWESTTTSTYYPNTMTAVKTAGLENLKTEIDNLAEVIYSEHVSAGDDSIKAEFEAIRNVSVFYYTAGEELEVINNPYHDLYSFCEGLASSTDLTTAINDQAQAVLDTLSIAIAAAYGDGNGLDLDYYETADASAVRGLSILIPHGELIDSDGDSYYSSVFWYTSDSVTASYIGSSDTFLMGSLDFCTYDNTGVEANNVETWRELFEAWYGDPGTY